jgi:hypothetical protein
LSGEWEYSLFGGSVREVLQKAAEADGHGMRVNVVITERNQCAQERRSMNRRRVIKSAAAAALLPSLPLETSDLLVNKCTFGSGLKALDEIPEPVTSY